MCLNRSYLVLATSQPHGWMRKVASVAPSPGSCPLDLAWDTVQCSKIVARAEVWASGHHSTTQNTAKPAG